MHRFPIRVSQDPERKDWIQCWNPSTGTYLGEVRAMNANNVKDLVRHAREAQPKWAATSFAERRRVLKALDKCILKNREELCKKSCIDTGKTRKLGAMAAVVKQN